MTNNIEELLNAIPVGAVQIESPKTVYIKNDKGDINVTFGFEKVVNDCVTGKNGSNRYFLVHDSYIDLEELVNDFDGYQDKPEFIFVQETDLMKLKLVTSLDELVPEEAESDNDELIEEIKLLKEINYSNILPLVEDNQSFLAEFINKVSPTERTVLVSYFKSQDGNGETATSVEVAGLHKDYIFANLGEYKSNTKGVKLLFVEDNFEVSEPISFSEYSPSHELPVFAIYGFKESQSGDSLIDWEEPIYGTKSKLADAIREKGKLDDAVIFTTFQLSPKHEPLAVTNEEIEVVEKLLSKAVDLISNNN